MLPGAERAVKLDRDVAAGMRIFAGASLPTWQTWVWRRVPLTVTLDDSRLVQRGCCSGVLVVEASGHEHSAV